MRVIYSLGAKFAGGGIGTTAYYAVRGIHRHRMLHLLLCGSYRPTEIPTERIRAMGLLSRVLRRLAVYDSSRRLNHVYNQLYDLWAARHMEPCDVFHGWGNFCLRSLRWAKAIGAVTIVERASSHPLTQQAILQEEYARWGMRFKMPRGSIQRSLEEIAQADYVLIPSDFVRRSFLDQGVADKKLIQVPFGVDIHRFWPISRSGARKPFRVLYVGQVSLQKGVLYLLEAWQLLRWRDAELWVVGRVEREIRPLLRRYTAETIRWVGYVSDPAAIYQQAEIFAFPSLQEGSALVTYEALASGLPVVTTPNAGSVVRDGLEGFIVPIRDVEGLAERLERLRSDEKLRCEMGKAARRRAEDFTWERYGDVLVTAYQQYAMT